MHAGREPQGLHACRERATRPTCMQGESHKAPPTSGFVDVLHVLQAFHQLAESLIHSHGIFQPGQEVCIATFPNLSTELLDKTGNETREIYSFPDLHTELVHTRIRLGKRLKVTSFGGAVH